MATKVLEKKSRTNPQSPSKASASEFEGKFGRSEVGTLGEMLTSTAFLNEELRVDDLKLRDYRRMRDNDGQVQMLLNAIYNTILAPGTKILEDPRYSNELAPKNSEDASPERTFIEDNLYKPRWLGGMSRDFDLVNRESLRAFEEGFIVKEVVYRVDEDGYVRLDKVVPRVSRLSDREVTILVDSHGEFKGFHQVTNFLGESIDVKVENDTEISKCINIVYGQEYGSNYGRPGIKAAWYHYDKAHKGMFINHVAHELGGVKFRLIKKKGSATDQQDEAVFAAAQRTGLDNVMMIDEKKYEVTFEQVSDPGAMLEGREMIEYHTAQIAKSLLAQFIDMGSQLSKTGARSLGQEQMNFFKTGLQALAKTLIEKSWDKIIADMIRINFGPDAYFPTLKVNPIEDDSIGALLEVFVEFAKKDKIPESVAVELLDKVSSKLGLDVSEKVILEEMQAVKEEAKAAEQASLDMQKMKMQQPAKTNGAVKLDDMVSTDYGHSASSMPRPLYPDEMKLKLNDMRAELDIASTRAESTLTSKLQMQKDEVVNAYVQALRSGRKAIKKVKIELAEQDTTYAEALKQIVLAIFELGKLMAANELKKSVPQSPKADISSMEDMAELIIEEQTAKLSFLLQNVANRALITDVPENDARTLLNQEFGSFIAKIIAPTVAAIIPTAFNMGRNVSFNAYQAEIFAYRYTAILDNRTTDYCRTMDGAVFQSTDPQYALVTPPNHFGCRSIWTPITYPEAEKNNIQVTGKPLELPVYSSLGSFKDLSENKKEEINLSEIYQMISEL